MVADIPNTLPNSQFNGHGLAVKIVMKPWRPEDILRGSEI